MAFELNASRDINLLAALEGATGAKAKNGRLDLPETFGHGYLQTLDFGPLLSLTIHQYELNQDVLLRKAAAPAGKNVVVFSFRNLFQPRQLLGASGRDTTSLPAVRVSSADMDFEFFSPAKAKINSLLIAADVALFGDLLQQAGANELVQTVFFSGQPYLYEEIISPEMQDVAAQLVNADAPVGLRRYYLKLKTEELIYLFLAELLKRQQAPVYPLNAADARQLYLIRDRLLADLSIPPNLPELARFSGLSESKMKRLFKQVFGTPIYNYYQAVRMQEAVLLLKEQQLTVSEVGYQLGFSNLSHFTRLFERHVGFKPKQYSKGLGARAGSKAA